LAINYDQLMGRPFADITRSYGWRDSVLYALGLGVGTDPVSEDELRYVYEKDLQALPTMAVTLGHPGFWISAPDTGIDFRKVVHGEQSLVVHTPLPAEGVLIARNKVEEIIDKGEGRGMIMRVRRDLINQATGILQSTQTLSMFCRGDGGFGGPAVATAAPVAIPERPPEQSVTRFIPPQSALIYRLSGDLNPLHADPAVARAAGFERPILHGLATFGVAGFALLAAEPGKSLREISCRFTAPVFPGESLRTDIWEQDGMTLFRCTVLERNQVVLNNGRAVLA
jgi:acyl dehydratase